MRRLTQKAPKLTGSFVSREQRLSQGDGEEEERRVVRDQRRKIAELQKELARHKREAATLNSFSQQQDGDEKDLGFLQAEVARLKEVNFDLEATLQTVEVEKEFAIRDGVAEAKAELQFKEAALARRPSKAKKSIRDRFKEVLLEDSESFSSTTTTTPSQTKALREARSAVASCLAFDSRKARSICIAAIASAELFNLAEALTNALVYSSSVEEEEEDDDDAAPLEGSVVMEDALAFEVVKKALSSRDGGSFVVALYRARGFGKEVSKTVWRAVDEDAPAFQDDETFMDLAATYGAKADRETLEQIVWPALARAARRSSLAKNKRPTPTLQTRTRRRDTSFFPPPQEKTTSRRRRQTRTAVRACLDLASALAVQDPERSRRLLASQDLLPILLNFANDSFEAHLEDPNTPQHLDDARALLHLLGHVSFFVDAKQFLEDLYGLSDLAIHDLRALCHRAKYALPLANNALLRDVDQLLALLNTRKHNAAASPENISAPLLVVPVLPVLLSSSGSLNNNTATHNDKDPQGANSSLHATSSSSINNY